MSAESTNPQQQQQTPQAVTISTTQTDATQAQQITVGHSNTPLPNIPTSQLITCANSADRETAIQRIILNEKSSTDH